MRIIIESDVFAGARSDENHGALLSLFQIGLGGHHTVEIEPEDSPAIDCWLGERDERTRSMCKKAFSTGIKQRARRRCRSEIRVANVPAPSWANRRFPPAVALKLAQRPLTLLLENALNESKFLGVLTRLRQDFKLDRLEGEGVLAFGTNGGIDANRKWLEAHADEPEVALRHWILCDSDAKRGWERPTDGTIPEGIGDGAAALARCCRKHGFRLHILKRRFIESYLPLPAIQQWSASGQQERAKKYSALAKLTAGQRHYYNMKEGFARDTKVADYARQVGDWYDGIDPDVRETLDDGIHRDIASLFHEPFRIAERWLKNDGQEPEVHEIVDAIMELI